MISLRPTADPMAWIQLIVAILLMYLIVGAAGYWGLHKRRQIHDNDNQQV